MGQPTITVFGHFEIAAEPRALSLAGGLQRMLLALLAGSQGRWVSGAVLAEALWPGAPPGAAMSRLHVHVHRLRTRLGPGAVEAGPDGYRLHLAPDGVDAWRFDQEASGTLAAHADGGDELALLERLDHAAACWRGEPYPGVDHPLVDAERHRLTELYLLVEETRAQHRLDRGDHRDLLEHLIPAACGHPTRERLHTLWMTALYRYGDHAQALEVYTSCRAVLASELGAGPGPSLQAIHAVVVDALGGADRPQQPVAARELPAPDHSPSPDPAGGPASQEQQLRAELADTQCPDRLALLRRQLGMLAGSTGRLQESLDLLFQAEARYRLHGPLRAHRSVLQQLAMEMSKVGDLRRALRLLDEAQQTYPGSRPSDRLRIVRAIVLTHMKDAAGADAALAGVRVPRPDGDPVLASMWWRARCIVARLRGRHEDAIAAGRVALRLAQQVNAAALEGVVMVDLACALRDADLPEAQRWYRAAVRLGHEHDRSPLLALAEASTAKAALIVGDPARATVHARESLRHARKAGTWGFAGRASSRLADAAEVLGESIRAGWYRQESLSQYRRVDYPLTEHEQRRIAAGPTTPRAGITVGS